MVPAAVGDKNYDYDLDSVFELIKSKPLVVKQVNAEKEKIDAEYCAQKSLALTT